MKNNNERKVSVFNYTDFRSYLKDYYEEEKKIDKSFSYRSFAKLAGYNSSSLYKDLVEKKRKMNMNQVFRFSKAMKLKKRETEYFENLVCFTQAKTTEEKKQFFERMIKLINPETSTIDPRKYIYFSEWFYPVIREILAIMDFRDDYLKLAKSLEPRINMNQAQKAVEVLEENGFIKRDENGYFKPSTPSLSTGPDVSSLSIKHFQKNMIALSKDAIDRFGPETRNISSVTMSIKKEKIEDIKNEIRAFRKRIVAMTSDSKDTNSVMQLNIQLFPLSNTGESEKEYENEKDN